MTELPFCIPLLVVGTCALCYSRLHSSGSNWIKQLKWDNFRETISSHPLSGFDYYATRWLTLAVRLASLSLLLPVALAPPQLGDLEEPVVPAAVPVQSPHGRAVVVRLPPCDAYPSNGKKKPEEKKGRREAITPPTLWTRKIVVVPDTHSRRSDPWESGTCAETPWPVGTFQRSSPPSGPEPTTGGGARTKESWATSSRRSSRPLSKTDVVQQRCLCHKDG